MEAIAHLKYLRISPRKVSVVLDLIRNKPAKYAVAILQNTNKAAAEPVCKLLKSAMANAKNNNGVEQPGDLTVKLCVLDESVRMRRYWPTARGSAHPIARRMCHCKVVLSDAKKGAK